MAYVLRFSWASLGYAFMDVTVMVNVLAQRNAAAMGVATHVRKQSVSTWAYIESMNNNMGTVQTDGLYTDHTSVIALTWVY